MYGKRRFSIDGVRNKSIIPLLDKVDLEGMSFLKP
jgi:hypothetical protein